MIAQTHIKTVKKTLSVGQVQRKLGLACELTGDDSVMILHGTPN